MQALQLRKWLTEKMTDEQVSEMIVAHEKYLHDRINGAYYAGVKKCMELVCAYVKDQTDVQRLLALMEKELKTLYV
jgi:hypothetical protein